MAQDIKVRIGTLDDLDEMMALANEAVDDNGIVNPEPLKLLEHMYAALARKAGLVGIIGKPGAIEAAILLRIGEMWYSKDLVIEEKAIFVRHAFRSAKGGRAARLCEFAKHTADRIGLPLMIGVMSTKRTAGKIRMYERQFGPPSGAYWIYGLKSGKEESEADLGAGSEAAQL